MKWRFYQTLGIIVAIVVMAITFVPQVRAVWNEYVFGMTNIDEQISYQNRKMVEDTARSMISNYQFAVGEYETYKMFCETDKYDEDRCQRALDSKASANKTASTYNNYLLKNKFLFQDNMPSDIFYELQAIK